MPVSATARLKHFGWGREGEGLTADEEAFVFARAEARFGTTLKSSASAPPSMRSSSPRRASPRRPRCRSARSEHYDRAAHTYGKAYPELARGLARDYAGAPDVVAYPRNEAEVAAVLDWAGGADATVTPFGGGSSVCGGVEPKRDGHKGAVTIDLRHMGKVKEVDKASRAALIEGGTYGPALEAQLRPHGLTLRHFPQSFEYSTLGGWIATRGGGHFATLYTHIDDFVESLRTVTPQRHDREPPPARLRRRAEPGPHDDRLGRNSRHHHAGVDAAAGSPDIPRRRRGALQGFLRRRARGARDLAGRALSVELPHPRSGRGLQHRRGRRLGRHHGAGVRVGRPRCRAVDEARASNAAPITAARRRRAGADAHREGAAGVWRNAFIRMPYAMERLILRGVINDTFETSITWDRFEQFHDAIKAATENAILAATGRKGEVTCRFTHVYPDGPAPYFTFHALGEPGKLGAQWHAIKSAALDAVIANGGTVTHHHAVGRDHRPWYDRQRPPLFADALRAAKKALDPQGLLNPGVLIDP